MTAVIVATGVVAAVIRIREHNVCVILSVLTREHVNLDRRYAAAVNALNLDPRVQSERLYRTAEQFGIDTGIYQCAEKHVAANTGEAIEISNSHAGS